MYRNDLRLIYEMVGQRSHWHLFTYLIYTNRLDLVGGQQGYVGVMRAMCAISIADCIAYQCRKRSLLEKTA